MSVIMNSKSSFSSHVYICCTAVGIQKHLTVTNCQQVAMRALGFEVKKVDVLKILKDYDREGNGKITFEDFSEVCKFAFPACAPVQTGAEGKKISDIFN